MKFFNTNFPFLIIAVFLLCGFSGCDHTKLTGTINFEDRNYKVGDSIFLELQIPNNLDRIYWVHWEIEPTEMGVVSFISNKESPQEGIPVNKSDRKAVFVPQKSGNVKIWTGGFFKQTNPQLITDTTITIQ